MQVGFLRHFETKKVEVCHDPLSTSPGRPEAPRAGRICNKRTSPLGAKILFAYPTAPAGGGAPPEDPHAGMVLWGGAAG